MMKPDQFCDVQRALQWSNGQLAQYLCKTKQSISNYRCGRQTIPDHVKRMLVDKVRSLGIVKSENQSEGVSP